MCALRTALVGDFPAGARVEKTSTRMLEPSLHAGTSKQLIIGDELYRLVTRQNPCTAHDIMCLLDHKHQGLHQDILHPCLLSWALIPDFDNSTILLTCLLHVQVADLVAEGYGAQQLLLQVQNELIGHALLSNSAQAAVCILLAEADKKLVDGADEFLQLLHVAAQMQRIICCDGVTSR